MATATKPRTKTEVVVDYMIRNPTATPQKAAQELAEYGVTVQTVHGVRYRMRSHAERPQADRTTRRRQLAGRRPAAAKPASPALPLSVWAAAKTLLDACGGDTDAAKQAVDGIALLQE